MASLPLAPGNNPCEFRFDGGTFNPVPLWKYQVTQDVYTQVMMAPVVADVNGDKLPDVLANFFKGSAYGGSAVMRALSATTPHSVDHGRRGERPRAPGLEHHRRRPRS